MMRNPLPSPAFGTLSRLRERDGERVVVSPFTFVRTGNGGVNSTFALANSGLPTFGVAVGNHSASPLRGHLSPQRGFTLVEMIVVMVITGILGGMVAMFIRAPMQGYVDSARRAEMTDVADTALRRITRDLRLALPNSVRVTGTCNGTATCYLEFLPTTGGGRYRADAAPSGASAGCGSLAADVLNFTAADTCFEVLGAMPPAFVGGESVVVYNLGIAGASAYDNTSRTTTAVTAAGNIINIAAPGKLFPFDSPGHRFQVITTPVTYACAPVADGTGGTLTRYWGYAITDPQPTTLATLTSVNGGALLATNVSACSFVYDANVVAQRSGLVTMRLGITEQGETVTLYNAAHVSNVP
ncbi:MAG: type II secretion system protein [Gallionellaceae bacterium]|nr:type II secretion system protein [Gallionellaceae bacterium]